MMTYNTKLSIGDTVWFMHNNKACSGKIKQIWYRKFNSSVNFEVKEGVTYYIDDIKNGFELSKLFNTKEELIDSL